MDERLFLLWDFDLQQPDLGGMEEKFLALQLENILKTLRLYGIYPYGVKTYFLGSSGCNNDSRYCFQELKFSSLSGAGPAVSDIRLCAGPVRAAR